MRLWSVHPRYFDRQALTAAWREGLLAQSVIAEPGRGYSNHPQLARFRETAEPLRAIGTFLSGLVDEADARGYRFDRSKIREAKMGERMLVSDGQLAYEWSHLLAKLQRRTPELWERWCDEAMPEPHPLFTVVPGPIASWERPSS
ncbi:pyrimidine dimer DNA glycosylase/endonuclease V [Paramicrobacterium agarici]|uniref:Pyrimidine dimer DNA glycosylase /DNA-(Apurinic or apyrimidinic site) lyase n=1 Tax=Paramicrobacterium agarici TaxID=630514 RepID=A0A2A9DWG1_9MICO|nr:pyrimidine dimer DNA glycosylase/endonuclease V [Microbacterium agarici]PFG30249.1 hypothetical protein ATJ78_1175 [Microbacterium agarici]TQO23256.1 hypothetical protein FB385_2104 [Microbacterium agarici]